LVYGPLVVNDLFVLLSFDFLVDDRFDANIDCCFTYAHANHNYTIVYEDSFSIVDHSISISHVNYQSVQLLHLDRQCSSSIAEVTDVIDLKRKIPTPSLTHEFPAARKRCRYST
jgi:hypothetical protein